MQSRKPSLNVPPLLLPSFYACTVCVFVCVCVRVCKTVTRSLKQKQPLRHEQQRLEISIFQSGVARKREREKHESRNEGGDPYHSKAFPWLTERVRLCVCVCLCVYMHVCVPFPYPHPSPTLTIVCTTSVTFPLIRSLNQWRCPKL